MPGVGLPSVRTYRVPRGEGGEATARLEKKERQGLVTRDGDGFSGGVWCVLSLWWKGGEVRGWRHPACLTVGRYCVRALSVVEATIYCLLCKYKLVLVFVCPPLTVTAGWCLVSSILVLLEKTVVGTDDGAFGNPKVSRRVLDKGGERRQSRSKIRWLVSGNDMSVHQTGGPWTRQSKQRPERRCGSESEARRAAPLGNE